MKISLIGSAPTFPTASSNHIAFPLLLCISSPFSSLRVSYPNSALKGAFPVKVTPDQNNALNHPLNCPGIFSLIKSTGYHFSHSFYFSRKGPIEEKGTIPASSHASQTSFILSASFLQFLHFILISSIHGLCISGRSSTFFLSTAFSFNSFKLPITSISPHSHTHIGKGNPQYLSLEISQSPIFLNHSSCLTFPY